MCMRVHVCVCTTFPHTCNSKQIHSYIHTYTYVCTYVQSNDGGLLFSNRLATDSHHLWRLLYYCFNYFYFFSIFFFLILFDIQISFLSERLALLRREILSVNARNNLKILKKICYLELFIYFVYEFSCYGWCCCLEQKQQILLSAQIQAEIHSYECERVHNF